MLSIPAHPGTVLHHCIVAFCSAVHVFHVCAWWQPSNSSHHSAFIPWYVVRVNPFCPSYTTSATAGAVSSAIWDSYKFRIHLCWPLCVVFQHHLSGCWNWIQKKGVRMPEGNSFEKRARKLYPCSEAGPGLHALWVRPCQSFSQRWFSPGLHSPGEYSAALAWLQAVFAWALPHARQRFLPSGSSL